MQFKSHVYIGQKNSQVILKILLTPLSDFRVATKGYSSNSLVNWIVGGDLVLPG